MNDEPIPGRPQRPEGGAASSADTHWSALTELLLRHTLESLRADAVQSRISQQTTINWSAATVAALFAGGLVLLGSDTGRVMPLVVFGIFGLVIPGFVLASTQVFAAEIYRMARAARLQRAIEVALIDIPDARIWHGDRSFPALALESYYASGYRRPAPHRDGIGSYQGKGYAGAFALYGGSLVASLALEGAVQRAPGWLHHWYTLAYFAWGSGLVLGQLISLVMHRRSLLRLGAETPDLYGDGQDYVRRTQAHGSRSSSRSTIAGRAGRTGSRPRPRGRPRIRAGDGRLARRRADRRRRPDDDAAPAGRRIGPSPGRDPAVTSVLVVDDEPALVRALRINLAAHDYAVTIAYDGRTALASAARDHPDVVILDLGLPDLDGEQVIAGIRGWSAVPIIVLSARDQEAQKVAALDAGADDYVTKPFGMAELLARVRAAARRLQHTDDEPAVVTEDFVVDLAATVVRRADGVEVRLTPTEWHLLEVLARHRGRLVPGGMLLREVWGPGYERESHYLRVYMAQLRRKLEPDPAHPRHLLTEPGLGYRLAAG